jgi:hypothetical protein
MFLGTTECDNYMQFFNKLILEKMKTIIQKMVLAGFIGMGLIGFNSCAKEKMDPQFAKFESILDVTEIGTSSIIANNLEAVVPVTVVSGETELNILLDMKEEEKLARDVYTALNLKWNNPVFSNISVAENTHMNAVIFLLQNYGSDYTSVLEPGKFTNSAFQILYGELVAKGSVSPEEAWKVGALIEEMDITDLAGSLDKVTDESIIIVFENLEKGSRNHLRSFTRQLMLLGLTYTPVYLSTDEYNQIISSPTEAGKQYQLNGNGNGKGRSGKRICNQL